MSNDLANLLSGGRGDTPKAMSGLPQYSASSAPSARIYTGAASPARPAGPVEMNALTQIGNSLMRAAGVFASAQEKKNDLNYEYQKLAYEQQQKLDDTEATNALATYHATLNEALPAYHQNFPLEGNSEDYLPGSKKILTDSYHQVYDNLSNDNVKRMFLERSHPITIGGYTTMNSGYYTLRNAQITDRTMKADSQLGADIAQDPELLTNPEAVYGKALVKVGTLAQGMAPEDQVRYLGKKRPELSVAVFQAMAGNDPTSASGAKAALALLDGGTTLDVPLDAQSTLRTHLVDTIRTAETRQVGAMYTSLHETADGVVGAVLNNNASTAELSDRIAMADAVIASDYATPEQKAFAVHQKNMITYAQLAASLNPSDKYGYQRKIEEWNPDSPSFKFAGGDAEAARAVYTTLKGIGGIYDQQFGTGLNMNGQTMTLGERQQTGIGPRLVKKEVDDATVMFMDANAADGDQVQHLIDAYHTFSEQFGNDPRLVTVGMQQLYNNDALHLNKQRFLALQLGAQDPKLQRHLVEIAGTPLAKLTEGWDPKAVAVNGETLDPTAFSRKVVNNSVLSSIRNNPALGIVPEQFGDLQELVAKSAAAYVNNGMKQDAAIKQAVDDILPGRPVGNMLINKQYGTGVEKQLNWIKDNVLNSQDVRNKLRLQMHAPMQQGNLLTFLKEQGARPTMNENGKPNTYDPTHSRHSKNSWHYVGSWDNPGAVDVEPKSIKDVAAFKAAATAQGFKVLDENYTGYGKYGYSSGPHFHIEKTNQAMTDRQYRQSNAALKLFKDHGYYVTDPKAPGHAVIPMYTDASGRAVPLADVNGQVIRVFLKDLDKYTGPYHIQTAAKGPFDMSRATGGF